MDNPFNEFSGSDKDKDLYIEYLKNLYRSITGKEFDGEDILSENFIPEEFNFDDDDSVKFFQEFGAEDNYVDDFINENDMSCKTSLEESEYGLAIKEIWSSNDETGTTLTRVYPFTYEIVDTFEYDRQRLIYELVMQRCIQSEDYEEASKLRDKLNLL